MTASGLWTLREEMGPADVLHGLDPGVGEGRQLWHLEVTAPTLVLGSAQPDTVDHAAAMRDGIAVVRRRSGGGAVLLVPGESTWVDVVLPRRDVLWDDDVSRSFGWLGEVWVEVLGRAGVGQVAVDQVGTGPTELHVHRGGLERGRFGAAVCFAGLGPGEVTVGGTKVVGLSQRRTRHGARFQCVVHHRWRPELYERLLVDDFSGGGPTGSALPPVAVVPVDPASLITTLREVLTTV